MIATSGLGLFLSQAVFLVNRYKRSLGPNKIVRKKRGNQDLHIALYLLCSVELRYGAACGSVPFPERGCRHFQSTK